MMELASLSELIPNYVRYSQKEEIGTGTQFEEERVKGSSW